MNNMFTDERTSNTIHANLNESVIHGTHRLCDLIPIFMEVIKDTPEYDQLVLANVPPSMDLDDEYNEWWDSDDAFWLYVKLYDLLEGLAPEGYYFGTYPGNESDFGFWKSEDNE